MFDKGFLHRMQRIAVGEAFNGGNCFIVLHYCKRQAGQHPVSIDVHRAGTTLPMIAAFFGVR